MSMNTVVNKLIAVRKGYLKGVGNGARSFRDTTLKLEGEPFIASEKSVAPPVHSLLSTLL